MFEEFLSSFEAVDSVIVTDIFASLREEPVESVTSQKLVTALLTKHRAVIYLPNLDDVVQYINKSRFRSDTVVITMGAGDIYTIHSKLRFQ